MSRYHLSDNTRRTAIGLLVFFVGIQPGFTDGLDFSSDDTVTVTAERAWESDETGVMHFSGEFELRAPDWYLLGDTVVVYGKLDDPDRVIVAGKPARIAFLRSTDQKIKAQAGENAANADPEERIDGTALIIEYFRVADKIKMRGAARLTRKDSTLVSEIIEYDIGTDRYLASGEGGIKFLLQTDED